MDKTSSSVVAFVMLPAGFSVFMALEKLIDTRMEKAGKSKLKEVKSKLKEIHCHKLSDLQAQQNVLNEWLLHEVYLS